LDRVPDHAAIHETVDLAKQLVRPRAGGLVNAVLRRVADLRLEVVDETRFDRDTLPLGDGRSWRLKDAVFAADPLHRIAQQTAHPIALLQRWVAQHGVEVTHRIAAHDLVRPPIIVAGLPDGVADTRSHEIAGFHVYEGAMDRLAPMLAQHRARVQDPAAARAVAATTDLAPRLIVDVCAGRGTKTAQLAALHPDATIIATDVDEERRAVLARTFAGSDRVRVVALRELDDARGRADLVVLDVPCTNTGVLARRVEAKYRYDADRLRTLIDRQRQIIADTLSLLVPGGHLLYTTCSIDAAENQEQGAWLERWHPVAVTDTVATLPNGGPGDAPTSYHDGAFHLLCAWTPASDPAPRPL
jgi:16S rRNA (cytosine967-C5)-methyltransferase